MQVYTDLHILIYRTRELGILNPGMGIEHYQYFSSLKESIDLLFVADIEDFRNEMEEISKKRYGIS
jgi:hypothetical protein